MEDPMNFNRLTTRQFAHPFDRPIRIANDNETHGVGRNSDAVGGYNRIGWYETFQDRKTGELYRVHCSDGINGVNGGKSAHEDCDLGWMESRQRDIIYRTTQTAKQSHEPIQMSSAEWALMLNRIFVGWLDNIPNEKFRTVGDSNRHLDNGQIGTINGVPVIVIPSLEDCLPGPPSDQI